LTRKKSNTNLVQLPQLICYIY